MKPDTSIDFEGAAIELKKELDLKEDKEIAANDSFQLGERIRISPDSILYYHEEEQDEEITKESLSEEVRYILDNYKPIERLAGYSDYSFEETEIIDAIVRTLSKSDLKQLQHWMQADSPIYWRLQDYFEERQHEFIKSKAKRHLSIDTLIKHYKEGKRGKKGPARRQLQTRFDYLSFTDQMKIIRLFLKGVKADREWSYRKLWNWWDDALIPDLEQAWLDYGDMKCIQTAALRLPEIFIKEHQEAMGKLDYKSVCNRLAHDKSFVIDRNRLRPLDYCYVIAHTRRHISDEEADQLLFGYIKNVLEYGHNEPIEYKTRFEPTIRDRIDDKLKYVPSLMYNRSIGYIIWALGQTGNASTLIKFHRWNKMLQTNMPKYLAEEIDQERLINYMNEDFEEYQRWNWSIFVKHARLTLPDIVTINDDNDKEPEEPIDEGIPFTMEECPF